ncbi:MAG: LysM peptidoglycan-binding domain-containing protein [Pseudochelatococcus sp.]|jgi:nucleoid-associated protein YgaU|uniref:LysM peptidoglycan-binding domain-containing protein n=1 Tax=Pseudochelatococcus sp. TaxID=2020869 RepID=UPI003D933A50
MAISGRGQAAIVAAGAAALAAAFAVFGLPRIGERPDGRAVPLTQTTPVPPAAPAPAPAAVSGDRPTHAVSPAAVAPPAALPQAAAVAVAGAGEEQAPATPNFDVVRVDPAGDSVVAGRASPGRTVELLVDGRVHDRAEALDSGAFALTPPPLPPGDHELTLREIADDGTITVSRQSVTIVIAEDRRSQPVVALAEPDRPTAVLAGPGIGAPAGAETADGKTADAETSVPAEAPAASPPSAVAVTAVEAEAGRLYVSGQAPPGAAVRLYLNDSYLAAAKASPRGQLGFSIGSGLRDGDYRVRLDEMSAANGDKVVSRAEVPFVMDNAGLDDAGREAPVMPPAAGAGRDDAGEDGAHVVVPQVRTTRVERGDSLWRISRRIYGRGVRYTMIYGANQSQIRNPDLIYPGQLFVLPGDPANPVVR